MSHQDFGNFVTGVILAPPTKAHHPVSQDLVSLEFLLPEICHVFITQKTISQSEDGFSSSFYPPLRSATTQFDTLFKLLFFVDAYLMLVVTCQSHIAFPVTAL